MHKLHLFIMSILILSVFAGCSTNAPYTPSEEAIDLSLFTAPEGYTLEADTQTSAVIKKKAVSSAESI